MTAGSVISAITLRVLPHWRALCPFVRGCRCSSAVRQQHQTQTYGSQHLASRWAFSSALVCSDTVFSRKPVRFEPAVARRMALGGHLVRS